MPKCRHCPALLGLIPHKGLDEWVWADGNGSMTGPAADLPPDPYGYLAALSDMQLAMHALHKRTKSDFTPLFWARATEYSMLKVRLEMGGTWHTHYPVEHGPAIQAGPLPWHCGWPMWLRPSGWQCRQCKARQEITAPLEVAA